MKFIRKDKIFFTEIGLTSENMFEDIALPKSLLENMGSEKKDLAVKAHRTRIKENDPTPSRT